jgi:hypothetical protein
MFPSVAYKDRKNGRVLCVDGSSLPQSWRCRPTHSLRSKVECRTVCSADWITAPRRDGYAEALIAAGSIGSGSPRLQRNE